MRKEELLIKEQRTFEATKKKLMGVDGKLGTILKQLGHPIVAQDIYYENRLNFYDEYDEEEIITTGNTEDDAPAGWEWTDPESIYETSTRQIGWHFDGLSRGMHLEIKYDDYTGVLSLHYKGYLVFEENSGDLLRYSPSADWEILVDRLYQVAAPMKKKRSDEFKEEQTQEGKRQKRNFLQRMKEKWGL